MSEPKEALVKTPTLYDIEVGLLEAMQRVDELMNISQPTEQDYEELQTSLLVLDVYVSESVAKRESVARFLMHLGRLQTDIEDEIGRLEARKLRIKKTEERLKKFVLMVMERLQTKNLEANLYTLKSKANPPKVEITDELAIPLVFVRQPEPPPPPPPKPDKTAIKKALQAGQYVPGAKLVQDSRLEIE
jgi:hypothetical protein